VGVFRVRTLILSRPRTCTAYSPEAGGATRHRNEEARADRANGELPERRSTDGGGLQYMSSLLTKLVLVSKNERLFGTSMLDHPTRCVDRPGAPHTACLTCFQVILFTLLQIARIHTRCLAAVPRTVSPPAAAARISKTRDSSSFERPLLIPRAR
jgi:hypothetical protein